MFHLTSSALEDGPLMVVHLWEVAWNPAWEVKD
jgi:hypothetical protein